MNACLFPFVLLLLLPACAPSPSASEAAKASPVARRVAAGPLPDASVYALDAAWTSARGDTVRLADFRGAPVLLAMVYTNCASACPLTVRDLKALAGRLPAPLADELRFVLVSLDPGRDTPEAMRHFAAAHDLGAAWTLLRGHPDDVQTLAALLDVRFRPEPGGEVAHSNVIHALDADGALVARQEGLGADPSATAATLEQAWLSGR